MNDGHASNIQIDLIPENTRIDAITFYSGRAYVFDNNTHMIYRYDSSGDGATAKYTNGKKWITDSGKPTDIVALTADTSLWLRTATGAVLKYTAGKLQPFHISNITPDVTHIGAIISGTSNNIYFLDDEQHRMVITDRDGKMLKQYQYDAATSLTHLSIDKNETTATGVTDDGHIVSFALSK
ncbi:MAG: hypothetical protein NT003_04010 [Candidatus Magasanikbacteria bacterium]|nr:hypothetical protein [Candidatus Magasanikbacteria bacterium]